MKPALKLDNALPSLVQRVDLAKIHIDHRYQRPLDVERVTRICKEFRTELCGPLLLNLRGNGEMYVIDGQHRLMALLELGYKVADAQLVEVSETEEARLFVEAQTRRKIPSAFELHRARVQEGSEVAVAIEKVLKDLGLAVSRSHTPRGIAAVGTLYRVWRLGLPTKRPEEHLSITLKILRDAWDGEGAGFSGPLMLGVSLIVFANRTGIDVSNLAERLAPHDPKALMRQIAESARGFGLSAKLAALELARILNEGRSRANHIDPAQIIAASMSSRSIVRGFDHAASSISVPRSQARRTQ